MSQNMSAIISKTGIPEFLPAGSFARYAELDWDRAAYNDVNEEGRRRKLFARSIEQINPPSAYCTTSKSERLTLRLEMAQLFTRMTTPKYSFLFNLDIGLITDLKDNIALN